MAEILLGVKQYVAIGDLTGFKNMPTPSLNLKA